MKLYSENDSYKIYNGDMLDMLQVIEPESIDAIVCDPPYELGFMNKSWDSTGIAFKKETWQNCFEVLKPGGYLLAFGGSRTYHRIACAIEDAGFEIRDCIMYLYGCGFSKSYNIGLAIDKKNGVDNRTGNIRTDGVNNQNICYDFKTMKPKFEERIAQNEWQGWGTCLKPAYEPIIVARKPFKGSVVDNIIKYRVGGINIDECRIENTNADNYDLEKRQVSKAVGSNNDGWFLDKMRNYSTKHGVVDNGRFPANVILTYDETDFDEVCGGMPYTKNNTKTHSAKNSDNNVNFNASKSVNVIGYEDSGSASRYFYCAKASKKDRDEGLDAFEERKTTDGCIRANVETARKFGANSALRKNIHPTCKPTELMQYLVRLVSPKGATILDPFMGSGSTGKAVMFENRERDANYKFIGIELTDEYLPIAQARIEYARDKFKYDLEQEKVTKGKQNIFDFMESEE